MTTTLTQNPTQQLHTYSVVMQSKELEEQDGYAIPADTQILELSYLQKVDRSFLENNLKQWLDDYHLTAWRELSATATDEF